MAIGGAYESGSGGYVFTGSGTPGDTVVVTVNGSQVGGTTVIEPDGSWQLSVATSLGGGDVVAAHGGTATGPSAGSVTVSTASGAAVATGTQPQLAVGATVITVAGNPGETIVIVNATTGEVVGAAVVQPNGQAAVILDTPVGSGETLWVLSNGIQEDTVSPTVAGSAPVVSQGTVLVEGSVLTGTGIPGATIQVVDDQGRVLGTTTVAADGTWALPVGGAVTGAGIKVVQDGVARDLSPALKIGSETAFLNQNVFRPDRGGSLDIGVKALQDGRLTVRIFNVAGEVVRQVADMDVKAGVLYSLRWNGRNEDGQGVSAGVYIVSVQGGGASRLRKVVVLK